MPKKTKTPTAPHPSIPMPARVQEDEEFQPIGVSVEGTMLEVVCVDERVEEEGEWWENGPVYKMHYRLTLEDGQELGIFRNYKTGSWYMARGD